MGLDRRIDAIEDALCDPSLASMVDLVLRRLDDTTYRVSASRGSVTFAHDPDGTTVLASTGSDPLVDQDPARLLGAATEQAAGFPDPADEARPHAHDEVAQFFDSPDAPHLAVVHAAAHRFHGNEGEHGSLGTVQRRAPFIAAGAGVRSQGWVPGHVRTVDVAPTVASLAGVAERRGVDRWGEERTDLLMARQDGTVIDCLDGTAAHVLLVLWDGCNANALRASLDAGEAPTVAGLIGRGTAFTEGMFAAYPSATLANHTTIGTGALPGHSGILHNQWRCSRTGVHHDLLAIDQMVHASTHLAPGVETLHEAVHRTDPGAWTGTTLEYCDRGSDWSTFRAMRDGDRLPYARRDDAFPRDEHWWERSEEYQRMSRVDETSLRCAMSWWADDHPAPAFSFCNFDLTDAAGHEGGPHGSIARAAIRDCDERLGRLLGAVAARGLLDTTAVVLVADHGMQRTSPDVTGDWSDALAGLAHTDIDDTFLYVD